MQFPIDCDTAQFIECLLAFYGLIPRTRRRTSNPRTGESERGMSGAAYLAWSRRGKHPASASVRACACMRARSYGSYGMSAADSQGFEDADNPACKPPQRAPHQGSGWQAGALLVSLQETSHSRKVKSRSCMPDLTRLADPSPASLAHSCLQIHPHSCPMKISQSLQS